MHNTTHQERQKAWELWSKAATGDKGFEPRLWIIGVAALGDTFSGLEDIAQALSEARATPEPIGKCVTEKRAHTVTMSSPSDDKANGVFAGVAMHAAEKGASVEIIPPITTHLIGERVTLHRTSTDPGSSCGCEESKALREELEDLRERGEFSTLPGDWFRGIRKALAGVKMPDWPTAITELRADADALRAELERCAAELNRRRVPLTFVEAEDIFNGIADALGYPKTGGWTERTFVDDIKLAYQKLAEAHRDWDTEIAAQLTHQAEGFLELLSTRYDSSASLPKLKFANETAQRCADAICKRHEQHEEHRKSMLAQDKEREAKATADREVRNRSVINARARTSQLVCAIRMLADECEGGHELALPADLRLLARKAEQTGDELLFKRGTVEVYSIHHNGPGVYWRQRHDELARVSAGAERMFKAAKTMRDQFGKFVADIPGSGLSVKSAIEAVTALCAPVIEELRLVEKPN